VKEEGNRKKRDSVERVKEKNIRRKGGELEELGRKEILPLICQFFVWLIPPHSSMPSQNNAVSWL